MKNIFIVLVCLFVSIQISAQVRQKDSHEHGAANLMMVMEEEKFQIEFEVPSESLIGFEHFPKSPSDRENFNEAIKILSDPSKAFSTPDDAECLLTGLNVSQNLFSSEGECGHEEEDKHGHEDNDEHGHEDSEKAEIHSEFKSNYYWNCLHIDEIDSIGNKLFSVFPRIEEIRVTWITSSGQGLLELESGNDRIRGW